MANEGKGGAEREGEQAVDPQRNKAGKKVNAIALLDKGLMQTARKSDEGIRVTVMKAMRVL